MIMIMIIIKYIMFMMMMLGFNKLIFYLLLMNIIFISLCIKLILI